MSAKKTTNAASDATEAVESAVAAGQEAAERAIKAATDGYEQAFTAAKDKVDEAMQGYDELTLFGRENVDAWMSAGNAYAKGVEQIAADWFEFSKQSMEEGVQATRAILGAKTLQASVDLQTAFAKTQFDHFVSQGTKVGELMTKVAQDAAEPLNGRMAAAVEKFGRVAS